jgi:hypothetical protein
VASMSHSRPVGPLLSRRTDAVMHRRNTRSPGRRSWLVLTTVAQNGADGQVTVSSSVSDWLMVPVVAGRDR